MKAATDLGPGVDHVDVVAAWIGLHHSLQHHLVLLAASTEAGQRLTAPAHCCLCQSLVLLTLLPQISLVLHLYTQ